MMMMKLPILTCAEKPCRSL